MPDQPVPQPAHLRAPPLAFTQPTARLQQDLAQLQVVTLLASTP
jgi:hypothetical protein